MTIKTCTSPTLATIAFNIFCVVCFHSLFRCSLLLDHSLGSLLGTTVAGSGTTAGSSLSQLYNPSAIYVGPNRVMYILDLSNYRVLRWNFGEPLGTVVAGGQGAGSNLNQISTSYGMFVDSQFNIYVSDTGNSRVTLWSVTNTTSGILVSIDR